MADYYALTRDPLPAALHGADAEYSICTLTSSERLAIEDYFFGKDVKLTLDANTTAVVVPGTQTANATMDEFGILVEFALGVLSVSGFQPVSIVASVTNSKCTEAIRRTSDGAPALPKFPKRLVKAAASTWLRHFFSARRKIRGKLYITAERYVRYLKSDNSCDALVDLCICLESLIESHTEISFRFSTCLAKAALRPRCLTNPRKPANCSRTDEVLQGSL